MDLSNDASQCSTGAAALEAEVDEVDEVVELEDLNGQIESLVGTDQESEDNGKPADQESLLPLAITITDAAPGKVAPNEHDACPEQEGGASPGALEQLKSSVKLSVKDVLMPSTAPTQNDNEAQSPEQAEESRGKMVCMTIVTIAK
eukprot:COSAG02_NODE_21262_length_796_cov_0.872310_1_plen_146_part_00